MIKCILSGKSLKQLFIIGLISCFILLGNSFVSAWTYTGNTNRLIYQPVGDIEYFSNVGFKLMNYGEFQSFYNTGNSYNLLYFPTNGDPYQYGNVYYGWINEKLYYYGDYHTFKRYKTQGFIQNFCKTTKDLLFDVNNGPYNHCDYNLPAEEFYSQPHDFVNIYSMSSNGSTNAYVTATYRTFCLEESNGVDVYCWSCAMYDNQNQSWAPYTCNSGLTGSLDFDINVTDFSSVADIPWSFSPWGWSSSGDNNNTEIDIIDFPDGYDYSRINSGDIVFYFENSPLYRFDKDLCYVGTNDYSTLYSSGSTLGLFKWGSGGSVFDLYGSQYGNTFTIKDLGTFINTWDINYYTWFKGANRDENNKPIFNAYYSLASGFYQDFSDNLSVPFIGNPIAFYFMGYVSSLYGNQSTLGEEIATYCYYKLKYNDNPGDFNITDNSDGSYWDNANDYINQHNRFYGLNSGGINIEAQSWDGSILDYYSGYDEKYDFNTFFSSAFNKFKDTISLNPSDLGAGVLPTYIILFLMAIVLFRFLSH